MNLYAPNLMPWSMALKQNYGMIYGRSRVDHSFRAPWIDNDKYVLCVAIKRIPNGGGVTVFDLSIHKYYALQPSLTIL